MATNKKEVAVKKEAFALALPEDLEGFKFADTTTLALVRENIGNQSLTPADFNRVRFPSGGQLFWTVPNILGKDTPEETLEGIILLHRIERVYWEGAYTGEKIPPNCASRDGVEGIGNPGGKCSQCRLSGWDTDPKGGGGQACKQIGLQFIMRKDEILPLVVQIPPTSLTPVKQFMLGLVSKGLKFSHCVISLGLESAQNKRGIKYSKIKPSLVSVLPEEARLQVDMYAAQFNAAFTRVTITEDDLATE